MDNMNKINSNNEKNFNESTTKIKKMYENLSYFDQYGNSIIGFFILSILVFITFSYFTIMADVQPIKDDWVNQRCNPKVIPFAGLINKPDDKTASEYTQENFTYCVNDILKSITGIALMPITFITSTLEKTFETMNNDMNGIRNMINNIRQSIKNISAEIMGKLLNVVIPIQQIVIGFKDTMGKTQGVLTGGLFTALGGYMTLESSLGAAVQLMINILIAMLATIMAFWVVPFTWGAATALSVTFLAIAIPLAIITTFMTQTMHIKTQGVPKLKCFDKNTKIKMNDGNYKNISDIRVRDILWNGDIVTATMKLDSSEMDMYELDGTIVSGCHIVKLVGHNTITWIPVRNHSNSKKIGFYMEPYLYCMNTTNKEITINNTTYTDWDEIYNGSLDNVIQNINHLNGKNNSSKRENIHKFLDGGFHGETLINVKDKGQIKIKDIQPNDILENDEIVYGIVEIDGLSLSGQFFYDLGKNKNFIGGPNLIIDSKKLLENRTLNLDKSFKKPLAEKEEKLYHLLTNNKTFKIGKLKFHDYNACIDLLYYYL